MVINMNFKKYFTIIALTVAILFNHQVFAETAIQEELNSGKVVVLIINANENKEDEQYADWEYYLNQFSKDVGDKYVFHKISVSQLDDLINDSNKYKEEYSMFFIKKDKPVYFYQGAIVESQVYEYIKLVFAGKPVKPEYLLQFSPEIVEVKFKSCK